MHSPGPLHVAPVAAVPDGSGGRGGSELRGEAGLLVAAMFGLACSVTTLGTTYSLGVLLGPLIAEFGWSREQVFLVQPISTLIIVLLSAPLGWLVDRHGVRRFVVASQILLGMSFMALGALTNSLTSFYVLYGLMTLGALGTIGVTFTKLVAMRFDRQRGLALGIAMAGTGVCALLAPPYTAWFVTHYGWRIAYGALGLLPLLVALPLSLRFVRDTMRPVNAAPTASVRHLRTALATPRFWVLCVAFFLCSGAMTALVTNLVPMISERGVDTIRAAAYASSFGFAVIVGRVALGALVDRFWAPLVGLFTFVPAAAAVALFASTSLGPAATIATIVLAGLAAGAEVDLMGYLVSRYFGLARFGTIYAGVYIAFALAPGIAVPLIGRVRDVAGTYAPGLYAVAASFLLCGLLLLTLGRYPLEHSRAEDG